MTNTFYACYVLAHDNVAIADLEKLRFSSLKYCKELFSLDSLVLIQTCNRTELYTSVNKKQLDEFKSKLNKWIQSIIGNNINSQKIGKWHIGDNCLRHLFGLVAGIESQAIGETQIISQVKAAIKESKALKLHSRLSHLFEFSFYFAKKTRHQTDIGSGATSLVSLSFNIAKQIFDNISDHSLCIVGAGEMGVLAINTALDHHIKNITVVNRSLDRVFKLANRYPIKAVRLDQLGVVIADSDIVISCINTDHYIITQSLLEKDADHRKNKLSLFIDLGLPRTIEPIKKELPNVYVYDLEKIATIRDINRERKLAIKEQILLLIESAIKEWSDKKNKQDLGKAISCYRDALEKYKKQVMDKAIKRLNNGEDPKTTILYLANSLTQKISHPGTQLIKSLAVKNTDTDHVNQIARDMIDIIKNDRGNDDASSSS